MQDRYCKLILAAFLLLQFIILFLFGPTPYPDCIGYADAARDAVAQGSAYPSPLQMRDLDFVWNLGAINAAALSLKLTHGLTPLLEVYTLLKCLTALLVYLLARHLAGSRAAFVALAIYVLYPANYGEATSVLAEVPFTFFIVLGLWLTLVRRMGVAGGIAIAVANWFRPSGLVYLVAAAIFLVAIAAKEKRRNLALAGRTVGGYIAALLIIGTITMAYSGRFMYQAQTGWMGLMQYSWDHDTDRSGDSLLFETGDPMYIDRTAAPDGKDRDTVWREHFFMWLSNGNVGEYLRQMPRKVADLYVSDNTTMCTFVPAKESKEYMYDEVSLGTILGAFPRLSLVQWLAVVNLVFYYLVMLAFLIALLRLRHPKDNPAILLAALIVVLGTLMLMFFGHGETRFHQPFMPFIIIAIATLFCPSSNNSLR